jgi:transglutaminase-like putative cysteine protease
VSAAIVVAWGAVMSALVYHSYVRASPSLAADLARYGSGAQWRGVYYRGEKIGFTVNETVPREDGFEFHEDGQLQMSLLGANTAAKIRTTALVDPSFLLQSFTFSLDAGTGPVEVSGRMNGRQLSLDVRTSSGVRSERRELAEPPVLALNLARRLANDGLKAGGRHTWTLFDPATLRNEPVVIDVHQRELVRGPLAPVPAFRVEMAFGGLRTTSWITDTGEVVREESPMGLLTIRETQERAVALAVPRQVQLDLLQASAIVPSMTEQIDDPIDVRRLRLRLEGADLSRLALDGVGQRLDGDVLDLRAPITFRDEPEDRSAERYLAPETFIESDAPEIVAETERALRGIVGGRAQAEQLTRYVNGLLEKKPTVSLPSAREVLRTRIGDCNEHTALYVAMARAAKIPARIAAGLVYVHGAFYYHAWPEVYLSQDTKPGFWLPVDPTFNQFPADGTHLRLTRGGLDAQATILPLIGRLRIAVVDLEVAPGSRRILVGAEQP